MGWPGPMTHRQFLVWQVWLRLEWDKPSRSDAYAMQVAAEVRRVLHNKPRTVQLKDFVLKLENRVATATVSAAPGLSKKELVTAFAKAKWGQMMGLPGAVFTPSPTIPQEDSEG